MSGKEQQEKYETLGMAPQIQYNPVRLGGLWVSPGAKIWSHTSHLFLVIHCRKHLEMLLSRRKWWDTKMKKKKKDLICNDIWLSWWVYLGQQPHFTPSLPMQCFTDNFTEGFNFKSWKVIHREEKKKARGESQKNSFVCITVFWWSIVRILEPWDALCLWPSAFKCCLFCSVKMLHSIMHLPLCFAIIVSLAEVVRDDT